MSRPSLWSRHEVRSAAFAQHGLLTTAQLVALGVNRSTLTRSHQLGGMFSRVLHGVHRVDGPGPLSLDQLDQAAQLYAGQESALTGPGVLRRVGVRAARGPGFVEADKVHVLVPQSRKRASHGFVTVERTVAMPPWREIDGLRVAALPRVVLDSVRRCTDEDTVRALIFEVVQRGLVSAESLDRERRRGQIRGSRFSRLALEEVFAGVRSVPEADLRRAFEAHGVTGLLYNPRLYGPDGAFLASPDVYDAGTGVCLEVDSREHHFSVESWAATMRRHSDMTAAGLAVIHVPPSRIATDPEGVLAEFLRAVSVRQGWPRPAIRVRSSALA